MKNYLKINLALWGMILCIILKCCSPAEAQTSRNPCYTTGNGINGMPNCIGVGTNTPLPVTASVTASISPFIPAASGARGTPITVGTTDSSGTLPTNTGAILVSNPGATLAYCNVNGIAATTADTPIAPGGGAVGLGVPSGVTTLHCISTGAGTTINTLGGSGLIAITGGGSSSGGGGGGTVTQGPAGASPWLVTGAGGTFPVTGTFWQATQPVSIATMPSTPVTGTFFQSTQPVSLATAPTTPVTGTFWPYTLGQQLAAASVPVILPAATITTLTPPTTVAVTQATAANLNMTCANCTGSGASGTDEGGFTAGSSIFAPGGGFFQTTATSNPLTTGQWGAWQMTANRAGFVNLRDTSGAALGVSGNPTFTQLAAGAATIGSIANTSFNVGTVTTLPALVTGAAIIGKVGIDQTTPGTTNLVSIGTNGTVNPQTAANWGIGTSTQNSAAVANGHLVLGQFNTTPTTITSGNMSPFQMDNAGNLLVNIKAGASSGAVAQGSTTSGQTGGLTQCASTTAAPTYTTATTNPVNCDTSGNLRVNVTNSNANGQATVANSSPVVLPAAQITVDPCTLGAKTNLPISQNGTASVQLIALSGSTTIYVCSLSLIAAGATTVAITTGTGTACVTGNAAVVGTTTASIANSMSLAANGGLTLGNGAGTVAKGAASGELCMVLGTSVFVSGNLTYVQL